ncbi:MAG: hypothetical protein DRH24_14525 [Deltaproteobacteria bacterium]|nr:MAG: hypothetical protein DRH24_14525 [Deltaproteobacteria bacterium]
MHTIWVPAPGAWKLGEKQRAGKMRKQGLKDTETTMQTFSFIGSDKNAGKTTALKFVYKGLWEETKGERPICLTSLGINGEDVDTYENRPKPLIFIKRDTCFITASEHLEKLAGMYEVLHNFTPPDFRKLYVMARSLSDIKIILEGPNSKEDIFWMKKIIKNVLPKSYLLIDGSIDRQFLAHPAISDAFYFAVLVSSRKEQLAKARDLLLTLSIPVCHRKDKNFLKSALKEYTKSLFFDEKHQVSYHGRQIPFLDVELKNICLKFRDRYSSLYLNGALTKSLFTFLAPFDKLNIILDNFTLYHNVAVQYADEKPFRPNIFLLYPVKVKRIFLKQEAALNFLPVPEKIPVCNLFRENIDEIGIGKEYRS